MTVDTRDTEIDEGIGSILGGKLADFAKGLIFKPRPVIVMHNIAGNDTIAFKIKRGILNHSLLMNDSPMKRHRSVIRLIEEMLIEVDRLRRRGYIEL